ncbi:MAG: ATP-binding protein [Saprospiraceae bacterium]|nr:ATP-binding protein [Saprospiraceae bacterium]
MPKQFLSEEWLRAHLINVKVLAGKRYTPTLNVNLPISSIFDGISRTKEYYTSIRLHYGILESNYSSISKNYGNPKLQKTNNAFKNNIIEMLNILKIIKEYDVKPTNWKRINHFAIKADKLGLKFIDELRNERDKFDGKMIPGKFEGIRSKAERLSLNISRVYDAQRELRHFIEYSTNTSALLSNKPFLFLKGAAGSGKTHLLCDLLESRITKELPAVLFFSEFISEGDLWSQFRSQLRLPQEYTNKRILELFDRMGKRLKTRSLIIIDALNESNPDNFWESRLNLLRLEISKYPNIGLIVSIRSGFEQIFQTNNTLRNFVIEEHIGFKFNEWEAVSKYFHEYSIPLPEIPILTPEFQNPLFLLLFCKAFEKRSKKNIKTGKEKQIFRGHEGATYIFENFVKSCSSQIVNQFKLPKGRTVNGDHIIWDIVIEKVAQKMIEANKNTISEEFLCNIINTSHPEINVAELILALDKNLLLVRIPAFSKATNEVVGFDFRFPFQKFSDHLLGRYIFKNLRDSKRKPENFFSKKSKIGKLLSERWNLGLIEALCIQYPEQFDGVEFFEVAPHISTWIMVDAFIESLIWRRPTSFARQPIKAFEYINKRIINDDDRFNKLLNASLTIAGVPNHPFNALFIHKYHLSLTLPSRDAYWNQFLHYQYGSRESVDRLIEWAWSNQDHSFITDDVRKLYSIALAWFLASSNRFIRDRTTKALVSLLTGKLNVVVEVLQQFKDVNDPYIVERLFAVAYGCALRDCSDKINLRILAQWFIENVFEITNPPINIMIREYASGVMEVAFRKKLIPSITYQKTKPPYNSSWPKVISNEKTLKRKYLSKNNNFRENGNELIWSSIMAGDFGRYVIEPTINHWSARRLHSNILSKKELYENFKKELEPKQLKLLNKLNPYLGIDFSKVKFIVNTKPQGIKAMIDDSKLQFDIETAKRQKTIQDFKQSISTKNKKFFEKYFEPFLDSIGEINDPLDNFDVNLVQRWILHRVVQLGWNQKQHGMFDSIINRSYNYGRDAHKPERIGKKYQWIALFEMLGMVADNFEFKESSSSENPTKYMGAWQILKRDIDPSCTLKNKSINFSEEIPKFKIQTPKYKSWQPNSPMETWIKSRRNLPKPDSMVELTDTDGKTWIILEGFYQWQEEIPLEYKKNDLPKRTLYYMFKSYLIKDEYKDVFYKWGNKQKFQGGWMPESDYFIQVFMGEYPSYQSFLENRPNTWIEEIIDKKHKLPAPLLMTDECYGYEGSTRDCSLDESLMVNLPSKLIIEKMNLHNKYCDGRFYNGEGDLVVCDAHAFNTKTKYLIMRKDKLIALLKNEKYAIFWTLLGEKNIIGGSQINQLYGSQEISGFYTVGIDEKLKGKMSTTIKFPKIYSRH